jgi:hypothetical protein
MPQGMFRPAVTSDLWHYHCRDPYSLSERAVCLSLRALLDPGVSAQERRKEENNGKWGWGGGACTADQVRVLGKHGNEPSVSAAALHVPSSDELQRKSGIGVQCGCDIIVRC